MLFFLVLNYPYFTTTVRVDMSVVCGLSSIDMFDGFHEINVPFLDLSYGLWDLNIVHL